MAFDITEIKVSEGQKALAAYVKKETGKVIKAETIAAIDALREAYRKDPARVAEREAVKAAARERKLEAYKKAVEKAAALAKSLGMPGDFDVTGADLAPAVPTEFEPEKLDEDNSETPEEPEDDWSDEEPEEAPVTEVEKPKAKPRKKAVPKLAAVPDEPTPSDDPDTSAIEVVEASDGWEAAPEDGDDFFDDDGAEEY